MCVTVAPSLLLVVVFKIFLDRRLRATWHYNPTEEELAAAKRHVSSRNKADNKLAMRFAQPAICEVCSCLIHHETELKKS